MLSALPPASSPTTETARLREHYRAGKNALLTSLAGSGASTRGIRSLLRKLARHTDDTLRQLWLRAGFPAGYGLVAVGGFGRGELFPHSDVDVLLLLPDDTRVDSDAALKTRIEHFIGSCWDTGLEIGSSVRTVGDCVEEAAKDVTVQTSLLEARLLAGSRTMFAALLTQLEEVLDPRAFFVAKTLEQRQRHNKFEDTPYSLEPNCKESPGGLRDLQVILWVARAAGLGKSWDDLAQSGLATAFEVRQIKANEALLSLIRARLHLLAGRREDRLVFDLQTVVAESFGYATLTHSDTGRVVSRASEALMKRFYWTAKAVTQLNQILLLNIEERLHPSGQAPQPINDRFLNKAGMIEVASDDLYLANPHAILETFLVYQTTVGVKGLSARTLRALYNARGVMDARFRRDPVNRDTFRQIMQQPTGITHAMRLMNQTSVLGRYLWVFRQIVGQMQHDLFHVYTVDQHILMVLRNVRRFFMAEHAHEYPACSQLAAGWDKPWILYVAALFHDIAKGRGGDHSELGRRDVRVFCRQHGIAAEDAKLIEFLVGEHLTMSRIAQKEDLSDPQVIAGFAQRVGNERYLTALYLLTVADIRGTSPKVWNAWKGKLLEDLYRYTLRVLGGRAPDADAEVEARKREALTILALHAEPFEAHKALWDSLDVSYFMRHEAGDIAWHARHLSRHVGTAKCIVRARRSAAGEGLQVLVYTPDAPDLFARICGYFEEAGFSILDAKVHTAKPAKGSPGYALDTFQVVSPTLADHYRELVAMVEADLDRAIEENGPLPPPGKGRVSRRVKSFPITPRVDLRPDEKAQRWLLSVSASDRVGLLYSIARVLARHRINLQLAKVTTLGERVEDTFLIDGPELQHNKAQIAIETELLEALGA
ncbi:MAG: [protein-PII] uridylyltransferase [Polaromonas sp.]|uniref:[protein-PII] uridylyltransferase n=1 Tax=Polaromonas sp. TaxID=1869339 RepID=UPI00273182DA|nr:[protein-PII] uridylyltransferase [Polaromonas sp.]MDP2451555.1 [protein-PII] uridylyltransferase [Polaromonas sp.]MDP3245697.1 [protein-PII] uridylyltransferase [Polaromonas sp.]MDP3756584.1 [protein-PII] uridylyltransferase [Polaromonas sp.]